MTRTTVDYGIDLGTTNSAVAVLRGTEAEIIKNNEGADVTPSAVYVDRSGRIHVGRRAKERVESQPENTAAEFKLRMGTKGQATTFAATGLSLEPEDLSAELLKSLRADVRQRTGEDIHAAVITVPAAFELNQTDATKRAAELAGLGFAPLIQEPTAAALAYGFQSEADNRFWLVYDLGGGTFDASIVHVREGELAVVNHRGDNFLGGKLIDWAIVEQLLIPAVTRERPLTGLARGVPQWRAAVAKLKMAAEETKIALSREDTAEIVIDFLCKDDRGEPVEVEYELARADVERLAEPFYARSVHICRQALAEAGLGADAVEKVVLVGGPTLAPHLRATLAGELGIELDITQDPLTVVARGAAVFAGTQRLPHDTADRRPGQYAIELDYKPIGADTEPLVGGRVVGDDSTLPAGLAVEFDNTEARPAWRSGKVPVSASGTFVTSLWAERGRRNEYTITLTDAAGRQLDVTPDSLVYTCGTVESQPLLTQTVGLGLADYEFMQLLHKGDPLPARRVARLRTTTAVRAGADTGMIRIPVLEGEHARADRNRRVGTLEVHPTEVTRDVPVGSEVEVTVELDASRLLRARAYVPLLDAEFDRVIDLATETVPNHAEVRRGANSARDRHDALRAKADANSDEQARTLLEQIDAEGLADEVESLAEASANDTDAAATGAKRIGDLEAALDEVEDALCWPGLVREAEDLITHARDIVDRAGTPDDARRFEERTRQLRDAMGTGDVRLLEQRCGDLGALVVEILDRTGALQVELFANYKRRVEAMSDPAKARELINQGERAVAAGDRVLLYSVNRQLHALLEHPDDDPWSNVTRNDR